MKKLNYISLEFVMVVDRNLFQNKRNYYFIGAN